MLNRLTIMGRLVRDPEYRTTATGTSVVNFTVAVDRDFTGANGSAKETDFIDCVAWKKTAEFVTKYFAKGSMIVADGRLEIRNWTDKDGNKRRSAELVANSVYFGESKRSAEEAAELGCNSPVPAIPASDNFTRIEGPDEDLPF